METPNHHSDTVFDESLYAIDWNEIENTERDYENFLSDIENFFGMILKTKLLMNKN